MTPGIFVELAVPDDSFLDVFCCGQARVDQYFRTREWLAEKSKGGSLTTYVFRAGEAGPVVGYAAVSFRNQPHPDEGNRLLYESRLCHGSCRPIAAGGWRPNADDAKVSAVNWN